MAAPLAIVFCVHHKPWLMMSTLITALAQDYQDADFYFLYNVGFGGTRGSEATDRNSQLSPFDERVREVCRLNRGGIVEIEYENDESLDSGAWYKFIRDGRWRKYDWVLFVGEGTLFARPTLVSGMLALAAADPTVHFIASGHEKRRLPKSRFVNYLTASGVNPTDTDRLHDQMIRKTFEVFCRDPAFRRLLDAWPSDFSPETQNHVPDAGPASEWLRRVRSACTRVVGSPSGDRAIQRLSWTIDYWIARTRLWLPDVEPARTKAQVYVNGIPRPADSVSELTCVRRVNFHRVDEPEWFGCATNHLMSRTCLERLSSKLEEFQMYDALDLRFAGSALEVIWGFVPAWLGFDKWFTDGFHRVRKDFVTYRREDYPTEMASYINRYYRGSLAVRPDGEFLKVAAVCQGLERLREELPALFF